MKRGIKIKALKSIEKFMNRLVCGEEAKTDRVASYNAVPREIGSVKNNAQAGGSTIELKTHI